MVTRRSAETGEVEWTRTLDTKEVEVGRDSDWGFALEVVGSRVLVATRGNAKQGRDAIAVFALASSNGGRLWTMTYSPANDLWTPPTLAAGPPGGSVFVLAGDERIHVLAIDQETGRMHWVRRMPGHPHDIVARGKRVYIGAGVDGPGTGADAGLVGLRGNDGSTLWEYASNGSEPGGGSDFIRSLALFSDGRMLYGVGSVEQGYYYEDDYQYADLGIVRSRDGARAWTKWVSRRGRHAGHRCRRFPDRWSRWRDWWGAHARLRRLFL